MAWADTVLLPNGDNTITGWTLSTGATAYTLIDEDPVAGTVNDADYIASPNKTDSSVLLALQDTPADFDPATAAVSVAIRHAQVTAGQSGGRDTDVVYVQLFKSDGVTALTAESSGDGLTGIHTDTKTLTISGSPTKADFDGALLRIRVDYTVSGGADTTAQARIYAVAVRLINTATSPILDNFVDIDGTALTSHQAETGHTYSRTFGSDSSTIQSGRLMPVSALNSDNFWILSTAAAGVSHDVEAVIRYLGAVATSQELYIYGRSDAGISNAYAVCYRTNVGQWILFKRVADVLTSLGTYTQALTPGTDYTVKLEIRDGSKTVYIDGVSRITSADNAITTGTRIGWSNYSNGATTTTGLHIDSLTVRPGATLYTVAISATATGTAALVRRAGIVGTQAGAGAAALVRRAGIVRSVTATGTAPAPVRALGLVRTLAATGAPGLVRRAALTRSATATPSTVLNVSRIYLVALTGAGTGTASAVRRVGRLASAAATGTATAARALGLIRSAAGTGTAAITRRPALIRSATGTGAASLTRRPTLGISAAGTGTATATRRAGIVRSAAGTGAATLARASARVLAATATGTGSAVRALALVRSAAGTGTATAARRAALVRSATATGAATLAGSPGRSITLAATASGSATAGRIVGLVRFATVAGTAALTRRSAQTIATVVTGTATVARRAAIGATAGATGAAALALQPVRMITLTATAAGAAALTRIPLVAVVLTATATGAASAGRAVALTLTATGAGAASIGRGLARLLPATATGSAALARLRGITLAATATGSAALVAAILSVLRGILRSWSAAIGRLRSWATAATPTATTASPALRLRSYTTATPGATAGDQRIGRLRSWSE